MLGTPLATWAIAGILALAPAAFRYWRNRNLARAIDDPALPERLLKAPYTQIAIFYVGAVVLAISLPWRGYFVAMMVMILAFVIAGFPLRKLLRGETWGVGAFLWFHVKFLIAFTGSWMLLVFASSLSDWDGRAGWIIGGVVFVILVLWGEFRVLILRRILNTTAVAEPMHSAFVALALKAGVGMPAFEQINMGGGVFANAFAMPSLQSPTVLLTSTLIDRLDEDERMAICAHELAHFEDYNRKVLLRARIVNIAIAFGAALFTPIGKAFFPPMASLAGFIPLTPVFVLLFQLQQRRAHETKSDLRAVALTGNPDAMIRALTKIHAMARLPRRWDPKFENIATHPSLTRRIQAIRQSSGIAGASLDEPVTIVGAGSTPASVTFHANHLVWTEGESAAHSLPYAQLSQLRVAVGGASREVNLVATDIGGRHWEMRLDPVGAARAQATLDIVDTSLGVAKPATSLLLRRIVAFFALLAVIGVQYVGGAVVMLLVLIAPSRPLLAAGCVTMVLAAINGAQNVANLQLAAWVWLAVSGAGLLWMTFRATNLKTPNWHWHVVNAFGITALIFMIPILIASDDLVQLRTVAGDWPVAVSMSLAFAVANALRPTLRARIVSAAVAAIGVAVLLVGTPALTVRFITDPLLKPAPTEPEKALLTTQLKQFEIDSYPFDMLLSPTAKAIAVVDEDDDENRVIDVGHPGERLVRLDADHGLFVDDRYLLLVTGQRRDTIIRKVDVDSPDQPIWSHRLERMSSSSIAIDEASNRWQLLGSNGDSEVVQAIGNLDGTVPRVVRWPLSGDSGYRTPVASHADSIIFRSTVYSDRHWVPRVLGNFGYRIDPSRSKTVFKRVPSTDPTPMLASKMSVDCVANTVVGADLWCAIFDGDRSRVVRIDPATAAVTTAIAFDGQVEGFDVTRQWVTLRTGNDIVAMRTDSGEVFREKKGRWGYAVGNGAALGTVINENQRTTVKLYLAPGKPIR